MTVSRETLKWTLQKSQGVTVGGGIVVVLS